MKISLIVRYQVHFLQAIQSLNFLAAIKTWACIVTQLDYLQVMDLLKCSVIVERA